MMLNKIFDCNKIYLIKCYKVVVFFIKIHLKRVHFNDFLNTLKYTLKFTLKMTINVLL